MKPTDASPDLSPELRQIVKWSVAILGEVIERELGARAYHRIESVRKRMANIRTASHSKTENELKKTYTELEKLNTSERRDFARSYTLMLELMNACENAYRTHRLNEKQKPVRQGPIQFITCSLRIQLKHEPQQTLMYSTESKLNSRSRFSTE